MNNCDFKLSSKQLKAVELLVVETHTQRKVAETLKIHENTVSNWNKIPEFKQACDDLRKDIYRSYAPKAVKKLVHLMEHADSETVQLNAAKDILDRAGDKPTDKLEHSGDMEFNITIDYGE